MAKDFWAIDCGGTETFVSKTNVTWESDDGYVQAGVSRTARNISEGSIYYTLRAFEAEKPAKGCYTIPVGAGRKVLASALFYYGNYDGKGEPPAFWLQFDANRWWYTVVANEASSEVIYVTTSNTTSICVAKGETKQTPFISAITVAVLDEGMYGLVNSSVALLEMSRVAFGANTTIRDKYFRYWSNTTVSLNISDYSILSSTVASLNTSNLDDIPPEVFQTAITPVLASSNITIKTPYLSYTPKPIYINMYFIETSDPSIYSGGRRSFGFSINGQLAYNRPIIPAPVGTELRAAGIMASNGTVLDLVPTKGSTLAPVVSAWELFLIRDKLNGTDSRDVTGLSTLQDRFNTLQDWAGDPCLPLDYNWEWVACNSDPSPRITDLALGGYGLSGTLPDFRSLDALQTIDLSKNNLTGDIPDFLGKLPKLLKLNLADNDFSSIPPSLVGNKNIQIDISGNPKINGSPAPPPDDEHPKAHDSSANINKNEILMGMVSSYIAFIVIAVFR